MMRMVMRIRMAMRMNWDPWLPGLLSDSSEMQGRIVALLSPRHTISFSWPTKCYLERKLRLLQKSLVWYQFFRFLPLACPIKNLGFTRPIGKPRLAEAHPNSGWDIFQRNCPENYLCLVRTGSVAVALDLRLHRRVEKDDLQINLRVVALPQVVGEVVLDVLGELLEEVGVEPQHLCQTRDVKHLKMQQTPDLNQFESIEVDAFKNISLTILPDWDWNWRRKQFVLKLPRGRSKWAPERQSLIWQRLLLHCKWTCWCRSQQGLPCLGVVSIVKRCSVIWLFSTSPLMLLFNRCLPLF